MKLIHRMLAVGLLLAMIVFPTSCTGSQNGTTTDSTTTSTVGTDPSEPSDEPTTVHLTLNGNELENYKIIYATHPYASFGVSAIRYMYTDYNFFKMIAEDIADRIEAQTGVKLTVMQDSKIQASDYEILVGPTDREESDVYDDMNVYLCQIRQSGTKLVVGGGYDATSMTGRSYGKKTSFAFGSTYHAWDYVEQYIKDAVSSDATVDLPDGFQLDKACDLKTVGCIGDSITEGFGTSPWDVHAYPAALQRILWKDYVVLNYGNSGRTMRNDLSQPYWGTDQCTAAIRNAKYFDLALIMLGTNDSYFDRAWTSEDDVAYNEAALKLVNKLASSNDDLRFVIMSCPVYYGNENSGSPHVRNLQAGLVSVLSDAGFDTTYFNMHEYTAENLGRQHFPDALHPDAEGYYLMAKGLSEAIPSMISGEWTYELEFPEGTPEPVVELPNIDPPEGSVNLIGSELDELYDIKTSTAYNGWWMQGTPYLFMDAPLAGHRITQIEVPVNGCKKGDTFTVSVVKYNHPNVTETLATYKLTSEYDGSVGWLTFTDLEIDVPEGYTVAFGAASDTLALLYITVPTAGYNFYGSGGNSINTNATLAFNLYGEPLAG
ncbi:MAG: GDSL-type esterase/lipase family protein [Eubacteriales bacterium]